jgi:Beta-propeller repeat
MSQIGTKKRWWNASGWTALRSRCASNPNKEEVMFDLKGIAFVLMAVALVVPGSAPAASPPDDAFAAAAAAQGDEIQWLRPFGTPFVDGAQSVATDSTGVYVVGPTADALPGRSGAGSFDAFVRKYDAAGNELWTRQFGTSGFDEALGVSADASGIYVVGGTEGALPGQSGAGSFDAFVRKYDAAGNELWTRQFGSLSPEATFDVSADASGVYVVGDTEGTLPGQTSAGGAPDAFVRKYDLAGTELWTKQFGTSSVDQARGVAVDSTGIYVGGVTQGTLPEQTNAGGQDLFALALDHDGNELWTKQFGSALADGGTAVALDASGVYAAGALDGLTDAFVAKLTKAGPPTIADLINDVRSLDLSQGLEASMVRKLERAQAALADGSADRTTSACNLLNAFAWEVEAQSGKAIAADQSQALVEKAEQVATALGCPKGVSP